MSSLNNSKFVGQRAEEVASWFFRLNGFFSIPSFVVHVDTIRSHDDKARTEADLMAVRFPFSREIINGKVLTDEEWVTNPINDETFRKSLFILVEVKAGICEMNGPWTNKEAKNLQRVLRRFGFTNDENIIEAAASDIYDYARWEGKSVLIQYICVGREKNQKLNLKYSHLVQIDWDDIGLFLIKRFREHPTKLPNGYIHKQWPEFGNVFGTWFVESKTPDRIKATNFIKRYIYDGID